MIIRRPMVVLKLKDVEDSYWIEEKNNFNSSNDLLKKAGAKFTEFVKEYLAEVQV